LGLKVLIAQFDILKNAMNWDATKVSKRTISLQLSDKAVEEYAASIEAADNIANLIDALKYPISGHNGEFLGVLAGTKLLWLSMRTIIYNINIYLSLNVCI
jgi:hypothetical protein